VSLAQAGATSPRLVQKDTRRRGLGGAGASAAILLVSSALLAAIFWPGHMDSDGLIQINEARTGDFNDWWAPVLDWFWRGLFLLHLSPGFVLWATMAVFLFAVYELLRLALGRRGAVIGAILIAVFPPILGFLGSLQRDTWFGVATLAAYALLARAQKTIGTRRLVAALGSLLAMWIALAARQNAIVAVLPAAVMVVHLFSGGERQRSSSWRASCVRIVLAFFMLGIFLLSQRVLTYSVIKAARAYPQQQILKGDLANLSVRTGKVLLPPFLFPSQSLQVLRNLDSPYTVLPLITGPDHPVVAGDPGDTSRANFLTGSEENSLRHDWISAVVSHPIPYLQSRWEQWTRLIAWSGPAGDPWHQGYDHNPWGYKATFPSLDHAAQRYLGAFTHGPRVGGPLDRIWVYLLLAIGAAADLLRRGRPPRLRLVGWLLVGAVAYYGTFFFLSIGQNYRFAWLLVTATVLGVVIDTAAHLQRIGAGGSGGRPWNRSR
jgi:hypothetical protein